MTRIGLVLGAGGMAGQAYHAGVLGALADEGGFDARTAQIIVGTSAGSIAAALLRANRTGQDLLGRYGPLGQAGRATLPPDIDEELVSAPAAAMALAAMRPGRARFGGRLARLIPAGRANPGGIITMVRSVAGEAWPRRSTYVCAVRRRDGRRIVFGHPDAPPAPLPKAVAASCAIPGFFAPVVIDGEAYVDGGAHSPTNLDLLAGLDLDLVVVSSPMSVCRAAALSPRVDLAPRLLFRATLAREARAVRRRGTAVVTIQPTADDLRVMGVNAMDPRRVRDVEAQARASTRARISDGTLGQLLAA